MIDLVRLADSPGGVLGQGATDIESAAVLQQFGERRTDASHNGERGGERLASPLPVIGIDPALFSEAQFSAAPEQSEGSAQMPDLLGLSADRAT